MVSPVAGALVAMMPLALSRTAAASFPPWLGEFPRTPSRSWTISRAISGETQEGAALSGCLVCARAGSSDACAVKVRHQSTNARRKMLSIAKERFTSHLETHLVED